MSSKNSFNERDKTLNNTTKSVNFIIVLFQAQTLKN